MKDAYEMADFFILTGETDFANAFPCSMLNNLGNLTRGRRAATICGFTPAELDAHFIEAMEDALDRFKANKALPETDTVFDL